MHSGEKWTTDEKAVSGKWETYREGGEEPENEAEK